MDLKKTPFLKIPVLKTKVVKEVDPSGTITLQSASRLKKGSYRMTQRLAHWAEKTPEAIFLGQRDEPGAWQTSTYRETFEKVSRLAQFLLQSQVSPERPIAILSENSIEHGLFALAALHIGVPYSPIATAYSLHSTDYAKLRHAVELLTPGLIFVQNGRRYEKALQRVAGEVDVVAVDEPLEGHIVFKDILITPPTSAIDRAYKNIQPSTVAKIMFTSGSTGLPKGVINTHHNITTNWRQITHTFPFFANGGLTLVDWLPWNHTFGGNHNFGLTLYNGGSLYIDGGVPTPKGIGITLHNLRDVAPTVYFNVPKGFEDLIPHLKADKGLCQFFFSRLKMFFYAGAGMPQHVWDQLEELAYETTGKRLLIASGLGMTEASPSCLFNTLLGSSAGMIGVPVPELTVKLIPDGGKLEARFKGANISPGYWRNPEATEKAFDGEGFYCTGDALKFADPENPNAGMIFDGRIAEDFKLNTGTWVNVGVLKSKFIAAGKGLIQDLAITGHDRAFLGAIVFPEWNRCKKLSGVDVDDPKIIIGSPALLEELQTILNEFAQNHTGSSTLIKRALFADFTLSIDQGEITDKGSINQRAILANRAAYVDMIYAENPHPFVLEAQGNSSK